MLILIALWLVVNVVISVCFDAKEMAGMYLYDQPNTVRILTSIFFAPAWFSKVVRVLVNWVIK